MPQTQPPQAWLESVEAAHKSLERSGVDGMLNDLQDRSKYVVPSDGSDWPWQWSIPDLSFVQKSSAALHALAYALASRLRPKTEAPDYYEYLRSSEWRIRRQWMLYLASYRCQLCNASNDLNVHHRTYDNVRRELPTDLTVLCRECHAKYHGKS